MLLKKFYRLLPIVLMVYALQAIVIPDERSLFFYLIGCGGFGGYYISIMIQEILYYLYTTGSAARPPL